MFCQPPAFQLVDCQSNKQVDYIVAAVDGVPGPMAVLEKANRFIASADWP